MRLVNLSVVKPGDKLSYSIKTQVGHVLLPAGTDLSDSHIQRLKSFGITAIYIQDDIFDDISVSPCLSDDTKTEALKTMEKLYKLVDLKELIDSTSIKKTVRDMVSDIKYAAQKEPIGVFNTFAVKDPRCIHAVNVATIVAAIAMEHGCEQSIIEEYAMAALLHDLHLKDMQKDNDPKHAEETKNYLKFIREYSVRTYMGVGMHHERYDGQGYNRLAGDKISEAARMIAVADIYDSLLNGYGDYKANGLNYAVEQLNTLSGKVLDPQFLDYFNASVAIYPVGATVLLNNNYKAVVVAQNYKMPARPKVKLSMKEKENCIEINLLTNLTTFIEKIL